MLRAADARSLAVVGGSFSRVPQNRVRLVEHPHALLGILAAIDVRMVLQRKVTISGLDNLRFGCRMHLQDFVIVGWFGHFLFVSLRLN